MEVDNKVSTCPANIRARIEMINGTFKLRPACYEAMTKIREILSDAAKKVAAEIIKVEDYDMDKLQQSIDGLQAVKDTACCAVILSCSHQTTV